MPWLPGTWDDQRLNIPPTTSTPLSIVLQELAYHGRTGNTSNAVALTIE